jgi:hypothetical protein
MQASDVSRPEVLADASGDELLGVGRAWKSLETWCFAEKLAVVRELIRRYPLNEDDEPGVAAGGLPDEWDPRLHHEVAAALGISVAAAAKLVDLTWTLDVRLPGISQALGEDRLDPGRTRMIVEETAVLETEGLFALAEAIILGGLAACKTWADLQRLVQRAVITVDPDGARRRRERAEREDARIRFWREATGTCALRGTGLPADQALAATANIEARALEYKAAAVRRPMDILRVMAYLDLINGVTVAQRAAWAQAEDVACEAETAGQAARDARLREAAAQARDKFREKAQARTRQHRGADGPGPGSSPGGDAADWRPDDSAYAGSAYAGDTDGDGDTRGDGDTDGDGDGSPDSTDGGAPGGDCTGDGPDGWPGSDGGLPDGCPGDDWHADDGDPGDGDLDTSPDDNHAAPDGAAPDGAVPDGAVPDSGESDGSGPCPKCGGMGGIGGLPIRANLTLPMGAIPWLAGRVGPGSGGGSGGGGSGGDGPGRGGHGGLGSCPACGNRGSERMPVRGNLTFPLLTLLRLAERPGEAHGLGALDPGLVRDLAAAGARHPASEFCVTITDEQGFAIGHGCCKPVGSKASRTIRSDAGPASFIPSGRAGPDDGFGSWILTVPGAPAPFTVDIDVVPTYDCDHRHACAGYTPSDRLRHLVQVRDGTCSFPACSRHARESDFEHARPFDKGGPTCACNAHACSRSCHRVKQSTSWQVTKPRPGWTQWTTMTGRTYAQGPWRYPA